MSKRILYWLTFSVTWGGVTLAGMSVITWIYVRFTGGDISGPVMMLYVPCVIGLAIAATGIVLERRKVTSTLFPLNSSSPASRYPQ